MINDDQKTAASERKAELKQAARQSVTDLFDALSDNGQKRLRDLARKLLTLAELDNGMACNVILDAEKHANRMIKRLTVPADMQRVELLQANGATLEFTGSLIHREEYQPGWDKPILVAELWETEAGAWVAVWEFDGSLSAQQLEAGDTIGAMEFWKYGDVARTLARKLKWSLRTEID